MIIVFYKNKKYSSTNHRVSIILASVFALFLPFLLQNSSIISFFFDLIFFPFTLIHELGHYLTAIFFFPGEEPIINIHFTMDGIQCASVILGETSICWKLVIVVTSGSLFIIFSVLSFLYLLRNRNGELLTSLKCYLIFGLLSDIPNLFPIYPQQGMFPDGFRVWLYLHELINLPYPTPQFSMIWQGISSILMIFSFYFLGKSVFHLLSNFKIRIQIDKPAETIA